MWSNGFVSVDDNIYITANPYVRAGLTRPGVAWAFRTYYAMYHPLTWISHMADVRLFGLAPAAHHAHSLLLHVASSLILYCMLNRATARRWPSALVALLFALHPLNVQSVAWAAERKNVLSTFFAMLALWSYARYAERPRWPRYVPVLAFLTLGLLAKPSVLTLPLLFLLLDYWPLGRFGRDGTAGHASPRRLLAEKAPLLLLSAAAAAVTLFAATQPVNRPALPALAALSLGSRLANAAMSCAFYLAKMFVPVRLTYFYALPHDGWPIGHVAAAALVLAGLTAFCLRRARRSPYLVVGWAWYLIALLPHAGLAQYGWQAFADRYAYLPLIGLFIALAWGLDEITARWRLRRPAFAAMAVLLAVALGARTSNQVRTWRDDVALFRHAVDVSPDGWVTRLARVQLGKALYARGRYDKAARLFRQVLEAGDDAEACNNLGACLAIEGEAGAAIDCYRRALQLKPDFIRAHYNLGLAYYGQGRFDDAIACYTNAIHFGPTETAMTFDQVIKNEPVDDDAHNNLGVIYFLRGETEKAVEHYRLALAFNPAHANAHYNLGCALGASGRRDEAAAHFRRALDLNPSHPQARRRLDQLRHE